MDGMYEDMEGHMGEDGEMMYGDEEGDMDDEGHHHMMDDGDSYGMEGSPEYDDVSSFPNIKSLIARAKRGLLILMITQLLLTCLPWIE